MRAEAERTSRFVDSLPRGMQRAAARPPSPVDGEREALGCAHDWRDARNEVVRSGEVCVKCHAMRAGNRASSSSPSSREYGRNYREAIEHIHSLPASERSAMSNRARPSSGEGDDGRCRFCGGAQAMPETIFSAGSAFVCGDPWHDHPAPVSPDGEGETDWTSRVGGSQLARGMREGQDTPAREDGGDDGDR